MSNPWKPDRFAYYLALYAAAGCLLALVVLPFFTHYGFHGMAAHMK